MNSILSKVLAVVLSPLGKLKDIDFAKLIQQRAKI